MAGSIGWRNCWEEANERDNGRVKFLKVVVKQVDIYGGMAWWEEYSRKINSRKDLQIEMIAMFF